MKLSVYITSLRPPSKVIRKRWHSYRTAKAFPLLVLRPFLLDFCKPHSFWPVGKGQMRWTRSGLQLLTFRRKLAWCDPAGVSHQLPRMLDPESNPVSRSSTLQKRYADWALCNLACCLRGPFDQNSYRQQVYRPHSGQKVQFTKDSPIRNY